MADAALAWRALPAASAVVALMIVHPAVWLDAMRFELGAALLRLVVAVVRAVAR